MFHLYYSNKLSSHKTMLVRLLEVAPLSDPFKKEIILVQSVGMAQWLQMQIAESTSIAGNFEFPFPTSFLWQQYRLLFPGLPKENIFDRQITTWRLMRIIPDVLEQAEFKPLRSYLKKQKDQFKLFQLSSKIADLFDQYLVYRPNWLIGWERNDIQTIFNEIKSCPTAIDDEDLLQNLQWQAKLWNELVADIKKDTEEAIFNASHRAYVYQQYLTKLNNLTLQEKALLPTRIIIFGISSLPSHQIQLFKTLSEHCDIHLFFLNPNKFYWGDANEDKMIEKLALKQKISDEEFEQLLSQRHNPLLSMWGKQGRDFLNLLTEQELNEITAFEDNEDPTNLLDQVKQSILDYENFSTLNWQKNDHSIQIHSCHSMMREVEVLHNQLLTILSENTSFSPKDIIVMSPDIEKYVPYIRAVFSRYRYKDERYIPYTISDQKNSKVSPIIASFLTLLSLPESQFRAEQILDLLDVREIQLKYGFSEQDISILRNWVQKSGIRFGLYKDNLQWHNYNSWENGLDRLLLGVSLTDSHIWQETIAVNESYGLISELTGKLAYFVEQLEQVYTFLLNPQTLDDWYEKLQKWLKDFYQDNKESSNTIYQIQQAIEAIISRIQSTHFDQLINAEVMKMIFQQHLDNEESHLNFLAGKVNFCTLLPMRAIPFKVVCLLGMSEENFPRQQAINSFDLMQYQPKKGDRARRDDDRYLFLESILSAQNVLYISYIGQGLNNNQQKLPSTLVSQFIDYIIEHHQEEKVRELLAQKLIIKHPMMVFSPQLSYDREWLSTQIKTSVTEFIEDNIILPITQEIDLTNLISFIQYPLRHFFVNKLEVNLDIYQNEIAETESFVLSNLEKYNLLNELLYADDIESFFEKEKLKGNLPFNCFGELSRAELTAEIEALKQSLQSYLTQSSEVIEIDQEIELSNKKIRLTGYIDGIYQNEIIHWRAGKLRDQDLIQEWIYYILLQSLDVNKQISFFYLDNGVKKLTFKPIEKIEAEKQLLTYLNDYCQPFCWAVSTNLEAYFKDLKHNLQNIAEYTKEVIEDICDGHSKEAIYSQRLLSQQTSINYAEIAEKTKAWFELLFQSKEEK